MILLQCRKQDEIFSFLLGWLHLICLLVHFLVGRNKQMP